MPLLVVFVFCSQVAFASSSIYWGNVRMNMSALNAPNRLPSFGGVNNSLPHPAILPTDQHSDIDDSCPDDVFLHQIQEPNPSLPYRVYNDYDRGGGEGVASSLPVVYYENDVFKITIDPAHGGKMLSIFNKPEQRELLFRNPVFQPGALGRLNAWTSGGVEWNWPRLGHTVFTTQPVYVAEVPTGTSTTNHNQPFGALDYSSLFYSKSEGRCYAFMNLIER